MVPANSDEHVPPVKPVPGADRLTERVRYYFDQHPEVSRDEFLLEALRREIYFRERQEAGRLVGWQDHRSSRWSTARPRPTDEDVRMHAWLAERLAVLHHERHGLWPRLRRFLFSNRLMSWLFSGSDL